MVQRLLNLHDVHSLFLFGARGTGKTTLLRERFGGDDTLWIDLLKDEDEERLGRRPDTLSALLAGGNYRRVVIDEVQKAPKLLDVVQLEIEKNPRLQFLLTGSSARKLKRGQANLLAGRAFTYRLFPLTAAELGAAFDLQQALEFGTLPKLLEYTSREDKNEYLRSYVKTYLREEVLIEQLVRQLQPFRNFLEVAAQTNGQVLNHSKLARDIGVDAKSVRNYFSILEDTLLGFQLPAFGRSIRKQQQGAPKFYLFDPGVARALTGSLRVELLPRTYAFGQAFEHWVILECLRKNEYRKLDYRLAYLRSKNGSEVDLVVGRPGQADLLVEIKSTAAIQADDLRQVGRFQRDWDRACEAEVWSLDQREQMHDGIRCLPWQQGLEGF